MPRKPIKTQSTSHSVSADGLEYLADSARAHTALTVRTAEIAAQFGDGLPYDRNRLVNEARFYMAQSAEAMLEAGKRLIQIKENEPHGEFERIVRESLGLPERTARRMIASSIKYLSPKLQARAPALALLGKTKLFELMTEDDEELAGLAEGGTVAGLTLDDIDRMTSRELKLALREAREQADAQSQLIASKDTKLNEMDAKLTKQKRLKIANTDWPDRFKGLMDQADLARRTIEIQIGALDAIRAAATEDQAANEAEEESLLRARQALADNMSISIHRIMAAVEGLDSIFEKTLGALAAEGR